MEFLTQQEINECLGASGTGFWKLEIEDGKAVRMYIDVNMKNMTGVPDGLSPEECYSFFIGNICMDDRPLIDQFRADMMNGDTSAVYRYEHPERGEITIRCSGKMTKNENGCITVMGYDQELSDVILLGTEQSRENQLLRNNRALIRERENTDSYYKNLMDMAACGIISYTLPERHILYMNTEALRIYGADDMEMAKAHMRELLKKTTYPDPTTVPKLIGLRTEDGTVDYECEISNSKGYSTSLLARTEIYRTLNGKRAVFTTFLDVSENTALKNEKNILDVLCMDYTSVYLCDLAADRLSLIKCSLTSEREKAAKQLGNERSCFSSRVRFFYDTFLVKESAPDFLEKMSAENIAEHLKAHSRFIYRFSAVPTDSGHHEFEAQAVRLSSDDGFKVVLGFRYIDDILMEEERQKMLLEAAASEARRANSAKTEFLRRMSHDVRTPINGIMGMLKIAEHHTGEEEKIHDCIEKATAASQQLLTLVNDVLDISKLEKKEFVFDNKPFDILPVLDDQMSAAEAYAAQYGVTVYGRTNTRVEHRRLIGSAHLLNRVLMNIAINAVKYNRPGGIVRMSCTELTSDEKTALFRFVCEDTGIGMSEEFKKHALEPYTQEGKKSNTSFSGTGLGLAIAKNITEQMNGTIELQSCENKGTTVTVTIPFAIDIEAENQSEKSDAADDSELSGKKALLVEDNELNREIAAALLEEFGIDIEMAENGKEAVDTFKASKPNTFDFVFMDIMMPVMDGLEASRQIRKLDRKDAATVPILAVSANAFQEDIKRSLDAGMNAHLTKPLEIDKIRNALHEVLNHKTA